MSETPSSVNADGIYEPFPIERVPWVEQSHGGRLAGDYVCFPAGQKAGHALINDGDTPCRYLIIGERNPNEVVIYTDSGRVGVRLTSEGYRKSATMDYWAGEDTGAA